MNKIVPLLEDDAVERLKPSKSLWI